MANSIKQSTTPIDQLRQSGIEIRADRLSRAIYSTDASIYQMTPDAVLLPQSVQEVSTAVRICAANNLPMTPRGAGTGLAGGAVNRGIQLDCSRHMTRIVKLDPKARLALVEPGVVLDELNLILRPYGLQFAPDVATSSRATIGGMIANNSCGAHSVIYGRTVDHVVALQVVLSDGSVAWWGQDRAEPFMTGSNSSLAQKIDQALHIVRKDFAEDIAARFPKVMRQNAGYALDRLRGESSRINTETILCGSEGTLGIIVGAVLNLTPLPKCRGLVVAHFADLLDALAATPACLDHNPAAVELIDKLILDAARENLRMRDRGCTVEGDPKGILVIELYDDDDATLSHRLRGVADDLQSLRMGYAWPILIEPDRQAAVWDIRKSGLGLLMSRPGQRQPYDFVDDTAVDPKRLRDYIARFMDVLREEGVEDCSYYAHASVGCLHVKPVLNLRKLGDVQRMYRVADRICALAIEFGGTMTGEHGDGIVRSCFLEKMYGPRIMEAFRRVKSAFDQQNIFNPGKIVSPLGMTENLRWEPRTEPKPDSAPGLTVLDFSRYGGMQGLVEMCSGVGQCRQKLVGTMCPSYMATGDEKHTTRARANALRLALSDKALIHGLDDPALDEVMDLCISCKACKSECPTGTDMAKLKAEWQHRRHRTKAPSLRDRLISHMPLLADLASRLPSITNASAQSSLIRSLLDRFAGLDRRIPLPQFAQQTFRDWWGKRSAAPHTGRRVAYFVDTWTNYFVPQVGRAAVKVLEALGHEVIVPRTVCCGRPAISKGRLDIAKSLAEQNAAILDEFASAGIPIIGTEPSCILTFVDEFPQLVRSDSARRIASRVQTFESFVAACSTVESVVKNQPPILYHGHCHQKALTGTSDAMRLLKWCGDASEINSGCCGMAGSFGHEKEHYGVSQAIGEQRLFPAIRQRGDAEIVVSGFSCRQQIEHHCGVIPRHIAEVMADAISPSSSVE